MTVKDKSYDELLSELPLAVRPVVAKARNNRVRAQSAYRAMLDATEVSKADIRELHFRHGLNPHQIARLLDMSRKRVKDYLAEVKP